MPSASSITPFAPKKPMSPGSGASSSITLIYKKNPLDYLFHNKRHPKEMGLPEIEAFFRVIMTWCLGAIFS
jgi:hypothetical protein